MMASFIWTSVWFLLLVELGVTLILVIPVPRKIRNFIARRVNRLDLGRRLGNLGIFLGVALTMAFIESVTSIHHLIIKEKEESGNQHHRHDALLLEHHDLFKQRKFRSERNMYLAGFSLTLLFVIVRLCQLMHESIELEGQVEVLTKSNATAEQLTTSDGGIELTVIPSKTDKKND
jgi:Bap31/Bap29 transmembrane region